MVSLDHSWIGTAESNMLTLQTDEFITSQLIMISHDRLAQYWEPFGHVSFYQRVDVEALLASRTNGN